MVLHRRRSHPSSVSRLAFTVLLSLVAGTASAQGIRAVGYEPAYGYSFADEAVRGAYVGAPFSSVPSPNRIVPAPWSYGTYGVPTLSGIRQAPVAAPRLTVIAPATRTPSRRSPGARILSRGSDGDWTRAAPDAQAVDGIHVIAVTVPRR